MSPKVDHRRLAREQRRQLKRDGFPERDIEAFARIFQVEQPDPTLPPCEQAH